MAEKSAKVFDGVALKQKRKLVTRCLAHLTEVPTPSNLVFKQMRLAGDEGQPADSGPDISQSLVKYYLNYKKSGLPKRLMFYKNGEWSDYPKDVVDLVKKEFEIKKATVKLELDGHGVVLDFLHMYNANLKTGLRQPIAWIDEAGSCFFPEIFASSDEEPNILSEEEDVESYGTKEAHKLKLNLSIQLNGLDESKLGENSGESNALNMDVNADGHDTTNKVGNENIGATANHDRERDLDAYTEPGYGSLNVDSVRSIFLTGMTTFAVNDGDIIDIYRSSSISMQAQLELFQKQADIIEEIHGDANVRYGWLACSKEELSVMMDYGLGHNPLSSSKCIYGFGVYLAAITHPYVCAPYCDVDENGVKHLVLCRIIIGNMEPLRRGNNQIRPSGYEYDNGVDDIEHPKYYVVWNMNMNTHIYPDFVVRFKAPLDVEENERSNEITRDVFGNNCSTLDTVNVTGPLNNTQKGPTSPWLPFSMLFAAIRSRAPLKSMVLIKEYYVQFMAKKISRKDFVMKIRLIVGDNIMRYAITNLQYKRSSNDDPDGGVSENF